MNAYCLIAHLPSTSLLKRDAGLCARQLRRWFEGRQPILD
jgi:hypothetical protein